MLLGVGAAGKWLGLPECAAATAFILGTLHLSPFSFQEVLLVPDLSSWCPASHSVCPLGADIAQEHVETCQFQCRWLET